MKPNIVNNDPTNELANYVLKEIVKSVLDKNQTPKNPLERCGLSGERQQYLLVMIYSLLVKNVCYVTR